MNTFNLKCVAIGDGAVGKTCLLYSYVKNKFPEFYLPTVFDAFNKTVCTNLNNKPLIVNLTLNDTAGQEEYDRLRLISYPETDIFLLCFSVIQPDSFINIKVKWYPEIKKSCPTSKIILVGTKKDLKLDSTALYNLRVNKEIPIDFDRGLTLAQEIGAYKYIECSAKTRENVDQVFDEAIKSCLLKPPKKKTKCIIL